MLVVSSALSLSTLYLFGMEPHVYTRDEGGRRRGWIEVVCGSMFSGKTEELIRRLRRATIARQRVALFSDSRRSRFTQGV